MQTEPKYKVGDLVFWGSATHHYYIVAYDLRDEGFLYWLKFKTAYAEGDYFAMEEEIKPALYTGEIEHD